jgi:hypothetical protein
VALHLWTPKQEEWEAMSGQRIVEAVATGIVIAFLLAALFCMGWCGLFHSEYIHGDTTTYMTLCNHAAARAVMFVEGKRALVDYEEWCR